MQQVVMNLITNASEAIGEQPGVVTLTTGAQECDAAYLSRSRIPEKPAPGHFAWLEVTDTGCGMDEETQQRMFDPFFSTKFTGRGLGMAAVLGIVRGHRGAILVDSVLGQGTMVRVLFPVVEAASEAAAALEWQAEAPVAAAGPAAVFSGMILVVDDEEPVRALCQKAVRRLGFRTLAAADGAEALRVYREHAAEIVCVILDLTMPKMNGAVAFAALQAINPQVKVILCSGYDEGTASEQFVGQGLAGFIQKPYRLELLQVALEQALG
jgi:two-component system, cell cycle sensor histidine kinase and response regulator CckA